MPGQTSSPLPRGETTEFEILGSLSAGRTSMVYLARGGGEGAPSGSLVVIKRLHPAFAGDPSYRDALIAEADVASQVRAPTVVETLGRGTDADGVYIVTEYIHGPCLARLLLVDADGRLQSMRLSCAVAIRIGLDVVDGLAALEFATSVKGGRDTPPLVHGHLTPDNILTGADGISRITDFGRTVESGCRLTVAGEGLGYSVAYAAPEVVAGDPVSPAADVFSLSVLLWEMIAGRRLFSAPTPQMIARQVLGAYAPDLSRIAPNVPELVACVVAQGLARRPERRFDSPRALGRALLGAMEDAFGIPKHEAVAKTVRFRCSAFLAQRLRMIEMPAAVLQSGTRPRV